MTEDDRISSAAVTPEQAGRRKLRSERWFGPADLRSFGHRSRAMQMGYDAKDWEGKPVIAILNTWSDINPCHMHFRQRVEDVKHGILEAGGFPMELPAISLSENFMKPTTMLYRNMLAMEAEELLRAYPADGAVLMGGCDKTTPVCCSAQLVWISRQFMFLQAQCYAATGMESCWGLARIHGNTGMNCAQVKLRRKTGKALKKA